MQAQKTELEQLLITQGVSDVYVCGIAADICVGESWHHSTVLFFGVGSPLLHFVPSLNTITPLTNN